MPRTLLVSSMPSSGRRSATRVKASITGTPRVPVSSFAERWFAELTERWLRRGSHRSTKELVASIRTWIELWNENPRPFVWHKNADEILESLAAYCKRISDSGH